jgi:hypothetical protein
VSCKRIILWNIFKFNLFCVEVSKEVIVSLFTLDGQQGLRGKEEGVLLCSQLEHPSQIFGQHRRVLHGGLPSSCFPCLLIFFSSGFLCCYCFCSFEVFRQNFKVEKHVAINMCWSIQYNQENIWIQTLKVHIHWQGKSTPVVQVSTHINMNIYFVQYMRRTFFFEMGQPSLVSIDVYCFFVINLLSSLRIGSNYYNSRITKSLHW